MELYIHIPFCIRKCNYCDFLSFPAREETVGRYMWALEEEIRRTGEFMYENSGGPEALNSVCERESGAAASPAPPTRVSTIFVGGGTPSILSPVQIRRLFACIKDNFTLAPDAEISMEANPGTLDGEKLAACREAGVNRLSIGLQSADDGLLQTLGRIHTWEQFQENYAAARRAGFTNINIDLMSALPGQSLDNYVDTLEKVTALHPEHISSYSLILEEGTPFYGSEEIRRQLPDEGVDREMYERTKAILHEKGYERYEISNYAKSGFACRHNLGYWDGVPYLGLGLGASSYYNGARFANEASMEKYLEEPFVPFRERQDYFMTTKKDRMEDYMIFGLRKMAGVSLSRFEREFGVSTEKVYGEVIRRYMNLKLLEVKGDAVRLTDEGIDVSNRIFEDFLL